MLRGMEDGAPWARRDWLLAGVLFASAAACLAAMPAFLGASDESHFIYHSLKVMQGAVPYRDFFDLYTPLAYYGMGLALTVLGPQIATVKIVMVVVHASTVSLLYASGRLLGARHSIAAAGAVAFLGLGPATWPFASPHWIATLLLVAILLVLVRGRRDWRGLALLGALTGALVAVQHQTGAPIALGVSAVICADRLIDLRTGSAGGSRPLVQRLLWVALPALAVVAAVLLPVVAFAGLGPVIEQLVLHPFQGYHDTVRTSWGAVGLAASALAELSYPRILAFLPPVVLGVAALRLALAWRRRDREALTRLTTLVLFAAATVGALVYYPDFIHLAFAAPVFLAVAVEALERTLRRAPPVAVLRWLPAACALALTVAVGVHLREVYLVRHADYGISRETAFGRVDFRSVAEADFVELVRVELDDSQTGELFCYPVFTSLYLMTGGRNPTRHVFMFPGYLPTSEYERTIRILEERRVPVVVMADGMIDPQSDPMYRYVRSRYRCKHQWAGTCLYVRTK